MIRSLPAVLLASRIACLKDPAPESELFITVKVPGVMLWVAVVKDPEVKVRV